MKELDNVILTSFNILHHFNTVYDVVGWIKDHIYTPENHTSPHSFKFEMVAGVVSMSYRLLLVDSEWVEVGPIIDDGLIGASGPAMKIPTFEKLDLDSLKSKIDNEHTKAAQTTAQQEEWESFIGNLERKVGRWEKFDEHRKFDNWELALFKKQSERRSEHTREMFYSSLTNENITESEYNRAQTVWREFKMRTLKEYHDLYLLTDVLLLADVFWSIDYVHFYTATGLSWKAALKMTKVKLELLSDIDQHLFVEEGIRGGVAMICKRFFFY